MSTEQCIDIEAKASLPLSIYLPIFRAPSLLGMQLQRAAREPHRHDHPSDLPDFRAGELAVTAAGFEFRCGFRCGFRYGFRLEAGPGRVLG